MAEAQHRRWVSERLTAGWIYSKEKDIEKKLSPYLIPWSELPEDIKEYDRRTIHALPQLVTNAKLTISKLR
jgi:hypothetical protein